MWKTWKGWVVAASNLCLTLETKSWMDDDAFHYPCFEVTNRSVTGLLSRSGGVHRVIPVWEGGKSLLLIGGRQKEGVVESACQRCLHTNGKKILAYPMEKSFPNTKRL